jgi:hypothetical protein
MEIPKTPNAGYVFSYDLNTKILTKTYLGNIDLETISESWNLSELSSFNLEDFNGMIVDFSKANFNFQVHEIETIVKLYHEKNIKDKYNPVFICTTPVQNVLCLVLEMELTDINNYNDSRIFYTNKAAESFLINSKYYA